MYHPVFIDEETIRFNIAKEKETIYNNLNELKGKFIVLIEGDHSEENRIYTEQADDEIRGILAVDNSLKKMGFNYKRVASTDKRIKDYLSVADYAFIYAQGEYGEDGRIQGWLDYLNIDYPGPGVSASSICCDKLYFKHVMKSSSVKTADYFEIVESDDIKKLKEKARKLGYPVMLKERLGGSSLGITLVNNDDDLIYWFQHQSLKGSTSYFMEKFISGKFVTVGIIKMSRGYYVLPVLSAETDSKFYDAESKLGKGENSIHYHLGGGFSSEMQQSIKKLAWQAFKNTGCEGISRVDMMIEGNDIFVLEINTIPGISRGGNFTQMFTSFGFSYDEMILAIMNTAYMKKNTQEKISETA